MYVCVSPSLLSLSLSYLHVDNFIYNRHTIFTTTFVVHSPKNQSSFRLKPDDSEDSSTPELLNPISLGLSRRVLYLSYTSTLLFSSLFLLTSFFSHFNYYTVDQFS